MDQYQARSRRPFSAGPAFPHLPRAATWAAISSSTGWNNDYISHHDGSKAHERGHRRTKRPQPTESRQHRAHRNREGAASSFTAAMPLPESSISVPNGAEREMELTSTTRVGEHGDVRQSASFGFNYGKLKSVTGINFRHTDGWRNTDMQWDQNQLKPGSTMLTVNRSSTSTLFRESGMGVKQKTEPHRRRNVLRTLGDVRTARGSTSAQRLLLPQLYFCRRKQVQAERAQPPSPPTSYGRYGYFYDYKLKDITDYFKDGDRITYYPGQRIKQSIQQQVLAQVKRYLLLRRPAHPQYRHRVPVQPSGIAPHHIAGDIASVYTLAAYAQEEWTATSNLILTAGVRGTQHKETGLNLSPKVSALYKAGNFNLRASYAMGFKAPTIKELYYEHTGSIGGSSLTAYHGNTDLKAQNLTIHFHQRGVCRKQVPGEPDRICQLHPQHDRAGRDKKSPPKKSSSK